MKLLLPLSQRTPDHWKMTWKGPEHWWRHQTHSRNRSRRGEQQLDLWRVQTVVFGELTAFLFLPPLVFWISTGWYNFTLWGWGRYYSDDITLRSSGWKLRVWLRKTWESSSSLTHLNFTLAWWVIKSVRKLCSLLYELSVGSVFLQTFLLRWTRSDPAAPARSCSRH